MFGKIGGFELIIILVVILLIFGPSKLPALARSIGEAMKEFKKGTQDLQNEVEKTMNDVNENGKN